MDLGATHFLDGQESWAGSDEYYNIYPGARRVYFETLHHNGIPINDGDDT